MVTGRAKIIDNAIIGSAHRCHQKIINLEARALACQITMSSAVGVGRIPAP